MDSRATAAREAHLLSRESEAHASVHRDRRDALIVRLHDDGWSYTRIAAAVGCSKGLVAVAVREARDV